MSVAGDMKMADEVVIRFKNVTKIYKLYKSDRARFKALFNKRIPYKENKEIGRAHV